MGNMNEVALQAESTFTLTPRDLTEAMEFAKILASSDMVPKAYIGKPGNVLVAVQMGAELGLKPMQSLQGIASINGNPGVWGDAMWALILSHPEYEDSHEDKQDTYCTVTLKRKNKSAVVVTFSMDDAKKAGLAGKQGPWQTAPKRMLQMRARAFACRDLFADALKGIRSIEELRDYPVEATERDITPDPAVVAATAGRTIDQPLPECTPELFEQKTPEWRSTITSKKKTPDDLIKFLCTRAVLTEEQKLTIHSWSQEE